MDVRTFWYNHFMAKQKPTTVDEYIEQAPEQTRAMLRELRNCLREAAPQAEESLKWGQPAFIAEYILFVYAGFQQHISFYPTWQAVTAFKNELTAYKAEGTTIQFPLDKPLPLDLIRKIADFRIKESKQGVTWK